MQTQDSTTVENYLISTKMKAMSFLSYQAVITVSGSERLLKSFALFYKGKRLSRHYLETPIPVVRGLIIEEVIIRELFGKEIGVQMPQKKRQTKKRVKKAVNKSAYEKAGNQLFDVLGL